MTPESTKVPPKFGDNYDIGYIGFSGSVGNTNVVSQGIAYFTRWDKLSDITVSHALIVTGENECVEAIMGRGVNADPLQAYFANPNAAIFFRKPLNYNKDIGQRIAQAAKSQVGTKYNDWLIAGFLLAGTFLGHVVNKVFKDKPEDDVNKFLAGHHTWICSELAAYCLEQQPEYKDKGILARPVDTIDPQALFEDQVIFTPWHTGPPC
ncbi:MAG TPA: hypothetical protein VNW72_11200 [Chthoniobacterales bacterium]|jgi:hypothetical protein|nr:hypothetical protein [Chthoniobacterales bacterium]